VQLESAADRVDGVGKLGEEAFGVPACAERCVDKDRAPAVGVLAGERRSQQLDTAGE